MTFRMDVKAHDSSRLCGNRGFASSTCFFAAQARCFGRLRVWRRRAIVICVSGVVVLRCFAWNARASACSSVIFVGPVVQSARSGEFDICQSRSNSFWHHSPALILDTRCKRVEVGFRDRRSTSRFLGQISWQVQYFKAFRADFVAGAALWSLAFGGCLRGVFANVFGGCLCGFFFGGGVFWGCLWGISQRMSLEKCFAVVLGNVFGRCL